MLGKWWTQRAEVYLHTSTVIWFNSLIIPEPNILLSLISISICSFHYSVHLSKKILIQDSFLFDVVSQIPCEYESTQDRFSSRRLNQWNVWLTGRVITVLSLIYFQLLHPPFKSSSSTDLTSAHSGLQIYMSVYKWSTLSEDSGAVFLTLSVLMSWLLNKNKRPLLSQDPECVTRPESAEESQGSTISSEG